MSSVALIVGFIRRASRLTATPAVALASVAACLGLSTHAAAVEPPQQPPAAERSEPWRETSAGADMGPRYWSAYTATVWAPYGPIVAPGLRMKTEASLSRYRYDSTRLIGGQLRSTRFEGQGAGSSLLLGYQWQLGTLTTKVYGGIGAAGHTVSPFDPGNDVQGYTIGASGALELWWAVQPELWASLDLTAATAFDHYGALAKIGWRTTPWLSLGAEAGVAFAGNEESGRAGALVRVEWNTVAFNGLHLYAGEATLAGGIALTPDGDSDAYGRISVLMRY